MRIHTVLHPAHILLQLQQYMQQQQQQAQIRQIISQIGENCFKMCIDGKPGTKLAGREKECMVRCSHSCHAPVCSLTDGRLDSQTVPVASST